MDLEQYQAAADRVGTTVNVDAHTRGNAPNGVGEYIRGLPDGQRSAKISGELLKSSRPKAIERAQSKKVAIEYFDGHLNITDPSTKNEWKVKTTRADAKGIFKFTNNAKELMQQTFSDGCEVETEISPEWEEWLEGRSVEYYEEDEEEEYEYASTPEEEYSHLRVNWDEHPELLAELPKKWV